MSPNKKEAYRAQFTNMSVLSDVARAALLSSVFKALDMNSERSTLPITNIIGLLNMMSIIGHLEVNPKNQCQIRNDIKSRCILPAPLRLAH